MPTVALRNGPASHVVGGLPAALEAVAAQAARAAGAPLPRAVWVDAAAPYHTPALRAAAAMARARTTRRAPSSRPPTGASAPVHGRRPGRPLGTGGALGASSRGCSCASPTGSALGGGRPPAGAAGCTVVDLGPARTCDADGAARGGGGGGVRRVLRGRRRWFHGLRDLLRRA